MAIQKTVTYKLLEPITFEGKEHTEITLRRIKIKDIKAIEKNEGTDQTTMMVARLSGWPYDAISEIDSADMNSIGKILESFTKRREISTGKPPLN
ncbi:phage tail assembly protein [Bartonella senegalensis]|uniref:phage tail assembly protein n=1 Tax=Bartonella senegalensis TaxID=1468418 RepID=UPI0002E27485|nr:phage tail assembly protein [Bartonella senegalensis]